MKFLFSFPKNLKSDLAEAMRIEKSNFETKMSKGMQKLQQKLAERMVKFGLKVEIDLSPHWDYAFEGDTKMTLDVRTYLDYIVNHLNTIALLGADVKKKLHLDNFKLMKWKSQSNESRNRLLKALKKYEEAEPELKITLMND